MSWLPMRSSAFRSLLGVGDSNCSLLLGESQLISRVTGEGLVAVVLLAAAVEEAEEVRKILYMIDHAAVGPGGNGLCAERLIARLSNAAVVSSWPVNISYKTCDQRQKGERVVGCVREGGERKGQQRRGCARESVCACMHADGPDQSRSPRRLQAPRLGLLVLRAWTKRG